MKIFTSFLLSLLATSAIAQQNFKVGLKAGINHANIKAYSKSQDSRPGFNAALFANYALCKRISLQPEVGYSVQGADYSRYYSDRLGYINIPVLVQYSPTRRFEIESGPQVGILSWYKRTVDPAALVVSPEFKDLDLAWVWGAAYVAHSGLGITVRYNHGVNNISRTQSLKNRVWQISLLYQFGEN